MTDAVSQLDHYARTRGQAPALYDMGERWNYSELAHQTCLAAAALKSLGVGKGDRVALQCFNTAGFVFALYGAWRLGASVVPVNHKFQAPEIEYVLSHSKAKVCIFDGVLAPTVGAVRDKASLRVDWLTTSSESAGFASFDALMQRGAALVGDRPQGTDMAEVLYTSGTTGKPKGCMHSHHNLFCTAVTLALSMGLTYRDRTLICMPIWHSAPLNDFMLGTFWVGGAVFLLREYAPETFLQALEEHRITFTFGAPIALLAPLTVVPDFSRYDLSAMRMWAYGGGPLGADMSRKLIEAYKSDKFAQLYGMTEAGPLGSCLYPEDGLRKAGSVGCCGIPGTVLELRAPDGHLCAPGEVGEVFLRSPAMMQGYLDDPEATQRAFDPQGWYASGDLAKMDQDGYLYIVDRLKDLIITGGENVYSKEVEDALASHPAILDVAVIGRPHPQWGETVVAVVVAREGASIDLESIRAHLQPKIANYKIPRVLELLDSLPRTPSGKLMKHVLRADKAVSAN